MDKTLEQRIRNLERFVNESKRNTPLVKQVRNAADQAEYLVHSLLDDVIDYSVYVEDGELQEKVEDAIYYLQELIRTCDRIK